MNSYLLESMDEEILWKTIDIIIASALFLNHKEKVQKYKDCIYNMRKLSFGDVSDLIDELYDAKTVDEDQIKSRALRLALPVWTPEIIRWE